MRFSWRPTVRRSAVLNAWLILLVFTTIVVATASAKASETISLASDSSPGLHLVSISPWTSPARPLQVRLELTNPGKGPLQVVQVLSLIGAPLSSRSQLRQIVAGGGGSALGFQALSAVSLRHVSIAAGQHALLPAVSVTLPASVGLGLQGAVVPLVLQVTDTSSDGLLTQQLQTFAVYVSAPVQHPVQMAVAVPVVAQPQQALSGVFRSASLAQDVAPGGRLANIVDPLARAGIPVTFALDGATLQEIRSLASGYRLQVGRGIVKVPASNPSARAAASFLRRLHTAVLGGGSAPVPLAYGNANVEAVTQAGLGGQQVGADLHLGQRALVQAGISADPGLAWPAGGIAGAATMRLLAAAGVRSAIVSAALVPSSAALTQSAPVPLASQLHVPIQALVPDALSGTLSNNAQFSSPALWAQRVVAESALLWLESPGSSVPRGVLLAPAQHWSPSASFVGTLASSLGTAPWLHLESVQSLAGVPPGPQHANRTLRQPSHVSGGLFTYSRSYRSALHAAQRALNGLGTALAPGPAALATIDGVAEDIALGTSGQWAGRAPAQGAAYLKDARRRVASIYASVHIPERTITLSARTGTIPITIENTSALPLEVQLHLSSARVVLTGQAVRPFLLAPGGFTEALHVRTRASGNFPIRVEVLSANGAAVVARGEVVVRSTALSLVAVMLTGGAGLFFFAWGWRWLKVRRRRATAAQDAQHAMTKRRSTGTSSRSRRMQGGARPSAAVPER